MQIECKRYDCQKAVEVCYWSCKHRKTCKDWEATVEEAPAALTARLEQSARKSGRVFKAEDIAKNANGQTNGYGGYR